MADDMAEVQKIDGALQIIFKHWVCNAIDPSAGVYDPLVSHVGCQVKLISMTDEGTWCDM